MTRPPDWRDDALCRETGGDVFFAADGERPPDREERYAQAKAICAGCPVRQRCLAEVMRLEHGLGPYHHHGIWGGLDPEERRALRRRLQREKAARRKAGRK